MASRPVVILHGWSDHSSSFRPLAERLRSELKSPAVVISLADYESMDDEVTFQDLGVAMERAWTREKLPQGKGSVDVVVHSTGGPVLRHWMTSRFTPETVPVRRLVMLAPANFGSPLAHKGYSFIGRVVKGWKSGKPLQTGERILKGLELGSPFTWDLAMSDRFGKAAWYGPGKILCTILVGNTGYEGISGAANEEGSDGTVRVSTANLNSAYVEADFSGDPKRPAVKVRESIGQVAFGVMDGENHRTITRGFRNASTLKFILRGLRVNDSEWEAWRRELEGFTSATMAKGAKELYTHGFQNTVVRVSDHLGAPVGDYFLEFYVDKPNSNWFEDLFHRHVLRTVHPYRDDPSYRSLLVDCTLLEERIKGKSDDLKISLTASPELSKNRNVGYRTFTDDDIGGIPLPRKSLGTWFRENRTLLVQLTIRREQADTVFRLNKV